MAEKLQGLYFWPVGRSVVSLFVHKVKTGETCGFKRAIACTYNKYSKINSESEVGVLILVSL